MKPLRILLCIVAIFCLAGCATTPTIAQREYRYEYVAQLLAMPSCAAKVEEIYPCYARLSTEDGKVLYVGSPGASPEVVGFVHTLQEGKTYFLPEAFMEYLKQQRKGPNHPDAGDGK